MRNKNICGNKKHLECVGNKNIFSHSKRKRTWLLVIKEKMHSVGFENRVLRGIFRSEKEKQGDWQKVNNNFSSLPNLLGRFTHGE